MSTRHRHPQTWKADALVDRVHARMRLVAFGALLAIFLGTVFSQATLALMQPLLHALGAMGR